MLALVPTRELAQQVQGVANEFGIAAGVRNCCVYGGAQKRPQLRDLERGEQLFILQKGNEFKCIYLFRVIYILPIHNDL